MTVSFSLSRLVFVLSLFLVVAQPIGCMTPPSKPAAGGSAMNAGLTPPALEPMKDLNAWSAVPQMTPGINIGNTLDNTTIWEVGWGQPKITEEYVKKLAALGFKTVRLPVAWDTYALEGRIQPDKMRRVNEVVDWIIERNAAFSE